MPDTLTPQPAYDTRYTSLRNTVELYIGGQIAGDYFRKNISVISEQIDEFREHDRAINLKKTWLDEYREQEQNIRDTNGLIAIMGRDVALSRGYENSERICKELIDAAKWEVHGELIRVEFIVKNVLNQDDIVVVFFPVMYMNLGYDWRADESKIRKVNHG